MTGTPLRDLQPWIHPALLVTASEIHGRGVVATARLPPGTAVIRFGGFLFGVHHRFDFDVIARSSVIGLCDDVLLAERNSADYDDSDFINHSCAPNLGMADAITLVTRRAVAQGEELTADYAYWEADEGYVMKNRCNCGQRGCRGLITGHDWSLRLDHLQDWAAPFIRRRIARQTERNTS